jgi:hypothetical protein
MESYWSLIQNSIPGDTPEEKYNNLRVMKYVLMMVAYPRRGGDDSKTIQDIANAIQAVFSVDELGE